MTIIFSLIVLDYNGIFVEKVYNNPDFVSKWNNESFTINKMTFFVNPDIRNFIETIKTRYRIAIWSSCTKNTLLLSLEKIFPDWQNIFEFVWYRDRCLPSPNPINSWDVIKPLDVVFKEFPQYNDNNCIIVDDSLAKVSMNKHYIIFNGDFDDLVKQLG